MTQEQAAEALGVSTQTVSRWECNTTLPDVTILPRIAALYGITIEDLYKEASVVYDNYACRLCSVFEASQKPEDFMQAELEYRNLLVYPPAKGALPLGDRQESRKYRYFPPPGRGRQR